MLAKIFRPALRTARNSHHAPLPNHGATLPDMTKWKPQTPTSFIHDGYAMSKVPFNVRNHRLFTLKATIFLAIGFWAPFIVVEYQLRKANQ
ncbi:unnamed protein product [Bursaphelenchus xylophilus]|uniref:(pine wood nematode) hypothetical protein n=1 Tax=Bursaphelenchus xylophilus TaxID=6326 RepID=A0A7I8XQN7_BURXY|nr:unnamed protein product [Bursaphelenchus xylophilus]CAG9088674.1 unnamed protein product [Bursaphelenchus xylophilus]